MISPEEQIARKVPPAGSAIQQIAFVSETDPNQEVLLEFPSPIHRWAVLVPGGKNSPSSADSANLLVLTVPAASRDAENEAEGETLAKMREWVESATPASSAPCLLMTLQGAQVIWGQGRLAILAQGDRLEAIRKSLVETSFYEGELRDIERALGEAWPQLEKDTPLAFEFDDKSVSQRKKLQQRFREILLLRARLARIGPQVHSPHLHPPTLASQVAERFRERTRMGHRHEFLDEQLEVFEQVYEMCGQRASDFMLTRSGNTLEWVIIILLLAQLLLFVFEYLSKVGQ